MTSFSNPQVEYHTSADDCNCYNKQVTHAHEDGYMCKHMIVFRIQQRTERRLAQGLPTNVTEARVARLLKRAIERENAAANYRMSAGYYE